MARAAKASGVPETSRGVTTLLASSLASRELSAGSDDGAAERIAVGSGGPDRRWVGVGEPGFDLVEDGLAGAGLFEGGADSERGSGGGFGLAVSGWTNDITTEAPRLAAPPAHMRMRAAASMELDSRCG